MNSLSAPASSLSLFHPIIAQWFLSTNGPPTPIQNLAWPAIGRNEHIIATAPTGSGKTLAAFLWPIQQILTEAWPGGKTSVLYISPLKALNHDIQRNLIAPLRGISKQFRNAQLPIPDISILTRSGDTTSKERRSMLRSPPDILITTPESLSILLNSAAGRSALSNVRTVILDEIHAISQTRRGTLLMASIERLTSLAGEFQRIALSATIRPIELTARFIGGYQRLPETRPAQYKPRLVHIIAPDMSKETSIRVEMAHTSPGPASADLLWRGIAERIREQIGSNRSTLIFTRSRRLCERMARIINADAEEPFVYSHHGSLSRSLRHSVERRLKAGELKGIVATNSLELGIDIGSIDEVVFVQSPPSVASAIQKLGRSGHAVGATSRGMILPTHPQDFLEAAALIPAVDRKDIEDTIPLCNPIDVLPQIFLSLCAEKSWNLDDLFDEIRCCSAYHELPRPHFDAIIDMLTGRFQDCRIRELSPRLTIDRESRQVSVRPGILFQLNTSGGVIPDRGYYKLRLEGDHALIGELDEEFVWEARVGQAFSLGTQTWQIERITHNDVFVKSEPARTATAPFWKADEMSRDFHLSELILTFLERTSREADFTSLSHRLVSEHHFGDTGAQALVHFLQMQLTHTKASLPHRHHILVEFTQSGPNQTPGHQLILHTLWGGRVNRPYSIALGAAMETRFHSTPDIFTNDDCIAIMLPYEVDPNEILRLVTPRNMDALIQRNLERTGFFGARFRECAGRAMLLGRTRINQRMPLWMNRLRSKRLMSAVMRFSDFPIVVETWRTCLQDEFDIPALRMLLDEIDTGSIAWTAVHTSSPSPFAHGLAWRQINFFMYEDDRPFGTPQSDTQQNLIRNLIESTDLLTPVTQAKADQFEQKLRRIETGYTPEHGEDLTRWIEDAGVIPETEWNRLIDAMCLDHSIDRTELIQSIDSRIVNITLTPSSTRIITLPWIENRIRSAMSKIEEDSQPLSIWIHNILQFHGPVQLKTIRDLFGLDESSFARLLNPERYLTGRLIADSSENWICDAQNYERLTRSVRIRSKATVTSRPSGHLNAFIAERQGIISPSDDYAGFARAMDRLLALPLPAVAIETDILPARAPGYLPTWLDRYLQENDIFWRCDAAANITFLPRHSSLITEIPQTPADNEPLNRLFPDPRAGYDATTLFERAGCSLTDFFDLLQELIRRGALTATSFDPIRNMLTAGNNSSTQWTRSASSFSRSQRFRSRSIRIPGLFQRILPDEVIRDEIDMEERCRDRIRMLLSRYGLLHRDLLAREHFEMQWSALFRSIRIMELAGEIQPGVFFDGLTGLQFMPNDAIAALEKNIEHSVFWMSTLDPAWQGLSDTKGTPIRRHIGTHVVLIGPDVAMISAQFGRHLRLELDVEDTRNKLCLKLFEHLLNRQIDPKVRIIVESVNGDPAPQHPLWSQLPSGLDCSTGTQSVMIFRST